MSARSFPEHHIIDRHLTAFAQISPALDLPDHGFTALARPGHNTVTFLPSFPSALVSRFLSQLALLGAGDLSDVCRQVEGYPYETIAEEYERATRAAHRTRRSMPDIELDDCPLLPITVANVKGGPSTIIRTSSHKDLIRVRGVPRNHEFARLANEAILKNMRAFVRARLPIVGHPRSARS